MLNRDFRCEINWEPKPRTKLCHDADVYLLCLANSRRAACINKWSENAKGNPYESCRASRERRKGASYSRGAPWEGCTRQGARGVTQGSAPPRPGPSSLNCRAREERTTPDEEIGPCLAGAAMPRPSGNK